MDSPLLDSDQHENHANRITCTSTVLALRSVKNDYFHDHSVEKYLAWDRSGLLE